MGNEEGQKFWQKNLKRHLEISESAIPPRTPLLFPFEILSDYANLKIQSRSLLNPQDCLSSGIEFPRNLSDWFTDLE